MHSVLIYTFVVVAVAPFLGLWRGRVWAKTNGKVLRATAGLKPNTASKRNQVA